MSSSHGFIIPAETVPGNTLMENGGSGCLQVVPLQLPLYGATNFILIPCCLESTHVSMTPAWNEHVSTPAASCEHGGSHLLPPVNMGVHTSASNEDSCSPSFASKDHSSSYFSPWITKAGLLSFTCHILRHLTKPSVPLNDYSRKSMTLILGSGFQPYPPLTSYIIMNIYLLIL